MAFHYKYPQRDEYDSEEEYYEAVKLYEWAESEYEDSYMEQVYDADINDN